MNVLVHPNLAVLRQACLNVRVQVALSVRVHPNPGSKLRTGSTAVRLWFSNTGEEGLMRAILTAFVVVAVLLTAPLFAGAQKETAQPLTGKFNMWNTVHDVY